SNRSVTVAPSPSKRRTSSSTEVRVRRSRWTRFFAVFGSGTRLNHMFGPPQAGASTNAFSVVESSSTSEPSTEAQNRAWASASPQSKVRALTNRYTGRGPQAPSGESGPASGLLGQRLPLGQLPKPVQQHAAHLHGVRQELPLDHVDGGEGRSAGHRVSAVGRTVRSHGPRHQFLPGDHGPEGHAAGDAL